jgi:hypothetical protein
VNGDAREREGGREGGGVGGECMCLERVHTSPASTADAITRILDLLIRRERRSKGAADRCNNEPVSISDSSVFKLTIQCKRQCVLFSIDLLSNEIKFKRKNRMNASEMVGFKLLPFHHGQSRSRDLLHGMPTLPPFSIYRPANIKIHSVQ